MTRDADIGATTCRGWLTHTMTPGIQAVDCPQTSCATTPMGEPTSCTPLYATRRAQLRHAWDAMAQQIAGLLPRHHVGLVVIGWPRGILHETTGTRRHHQMTHAFWRFAQVIERITLALERCGITVERVGARGTSSTCCRCGSVRVRRTPRHRVTCYDCISSSIVTKPARTISYVKKPQPWPETGARRPFGLKPIAGPASNGLTSSILRPLRSETARHSRTGILGLPAGEEVNDTQ
jgi:hypothetical protein